MNWDLPDNWLGVCLALIGLAAVALIFATARGCAETQSKLYVECVKNMTGKSALEIQQACSRVKDI